jgi:hypothetical protein
VSHTLAMGLSSDSISSCSYVGGRKLWSRLVRNVQSIGMLLGTLVSLVTTVVFTSLCQPWLTVFIHSVMLHL